ncbi:MspA family porin [Nocardia sp. NPDC059239]|uniref:MspA family porin n=1 Tax=unclassified Nocardia TaxID=2637762 RepID=UPI0036C62B39
MARNRTQKRTQVLASVGTIAACGTFFGTVTIGPATADTFVPLPDGQRQGPDSVTITRNGEHAIISPSLAANGAGRNVWVSGNVSADVPNAPSTTPGPFNFPSGNPGTNNSSTHGTSQLNTGYIIGCQVSIADDAISAGIAAGISTTGANASGSLGVNIGPGEVKFVPIDFKDITAPGTYSVEYQDVQMDIQGCAGYAQARAYTVVEVVGDHYSKTSLYGQPFSIG